MSVTSSIKPNSSRHRDSVRHAISQLGSKHSLDLGSAAKDRSVKQQKFYKQLYEVWRYVQLRDRAAADKIVSDFNQKATQLRFNWVYKPDAETDVLPSRDAFATTGKEVLAVKLPSEKQEALKSYLLHQLQGAKDHCILMGSSQNLPLRSQIEQSPKKKKYASPSSSSSQVTGSSMDEAFQNFDLSAIENEGTPRARRPAALCSRNESGSFREEEMTEVEEVYETANESVSPEKYVKSFSSMRQYQTSSSRKRPSGEFSKDERSRKRAVHRSDSMPVTSAGSPSRYQHAPMPTSHSFTSPHSTPSEVFDQKSSRNTSFKTEATSFSFNKQSSPKCEIEKGRDRSSSSDSQWNTDNLTNLATSGADKYSTAPTQFSDAKISRLKASSDMHYSEKTFAQRLWEQSPLARSADKTPENLPFRLAYEVTRVALDSQTPIESLYDHLDTLQQSRLNDYEYFWPGLIKGIKHITKPLPERSPLRAWQETADTFNRVNLKGELHLNLSAKEPLFRLTLHPLAWGDSYRAARHYGFHRFMVLLIPALDLKDLPKHVSCHGESARTAIIEWLALQSHFVLGREWRAWDVKPRKRGKANTRDSSNAQWLVHLFAVDGYGFHRIAQCPSDPYQQLSISDFLKWIIPFKKNRDASVLKLFSRLQLAVSSTTPTIVFPLDRMIRCDDATSDAPMRRRLNVQRHLEKLAGTGSKPRGNVMSDGCARISQAAAKEIAEKLGIYDYVPSAFQARIGGSKGVWLVDTSGETFNGEPMWIEIADSQLKFEVYKSSQYDSDDDRLNFEVRSYSKPLKPAYLNFQLMPILINQGVNPEIFKTRLHEDLQQKADDLVASMEDPLKLRSWNQRHNSVKASRLETGGIEMVGAMPKSDAEQINTYTESGFDPKSLGQLQKLCRTLIGDYCTRLEERMHIELGQSAYVLMVPDFANVLEENEIHLGFSSKFQDYKSGFCDTMVNDRDILVARVPAALPSDIQKVKAVFKPELAGLKDVIVFPTKGKISLAEKLSGGDFDGDLAWVCWDQDIIAGFRSAHLPPPQSPESYGISKEEKKMSELMKENDYIDKFLLEGFLFNMRSSLLGMCTSFHEALCYDLMKDSRSKSMGHRAAVRIGQLLGFLVDTAKNGYIFDDQRWEKCKAFEGLKRFYPKPAYKDRIGKATPHIIDQLVLVVAKSIRQKTLSDFEKNFAKEPEKDMDLVSVIKVEEEFGQNDGDLEFTLSGLKSQFDKLYNDWIIGYSHYKSKKLSYAALAEQIREQFQQIQPWTKDRHLHPPNNALVWRWIHEQDDPKKGSSFMGSWPRVKASALYRYKSRGPFPFLACGLELMQIKANKDGMPRTIHPDMYRFTKLDSKMLETSLQRQANGLLPADDPDVVLHDSDAYDIMSQNYAEAFETMSMAE